MSLTFYCFYFFATYNCLVKSLFGASYVVCSTKNEKIKLLSDSEGGIKRKENEKRGYRRIESFLVLF